MVKYEYSLFFSRDKRISVDWIFSNYRLLLKRIDWF